MNLVIFDRPELDFKTFFGELTKKLKHLSVILLNLCVDLYLHKTQREILMVAINNFFFIGEATVFQ